MNSEIRIGQKEYHIQTEDWGWDNPYIVTKVFSQGAVLKSFKIPYQNLLSSPFPTENSIRSAIEHQHREILDRLISGQLDT